MTERKNPFSPEITGYAGDGTFLRGEPQGQRERAKAGGARGRKAFWKIKGRAKKPSAKLMKKQKNIGEVETTIETE